jgi:hypothetical protein
LHERTQKEAINPRLKALAIDSNHDEVTKAGYNYRQRHVYPKLEAIGFDILRCQGSLARRVHVEWTALSQDIVYITGVGHGSHTAYMGDQDIPVFEIGLYKPDAVKGKILHFLSCYTAGNLGPDFVEKSRLAYFGYDERFIVDMGHADRCFECDSEIDLALAEGVSAGEVYDRVKVIFDRNIEELEDQGLFDVANVLRFNFAHLCAPSIDKRWGDTGAKLRSARTKKKWQI